MRRQNFATRVGAAGTIAGILVLGISAPGCTGSDSGQDDQDTIIGQTADEFVNNVPMTCVNIQRGQVGTVADTYVHSGNPSTNYGSALDLSVGPSTQSLLKFNIGNAVPANVTLTKAQLIVRVTQGNGATVSVRQSLSSWGEGTATYNNYGTNYGPVDATYPSTVTNTTTIVDVLARAQSWVNGATNNGWVLTSPSFSSLVSSENAGSFKPRLRLCWFPDNDGDGYPADQDCNDNNPNIHPGAAELCDGVDNNCNDVIDENDPQGGGACSTGLQGACAAGVAHCTNGAVTCAQTTQPSAETCDGQDNDCDGQTDEGGVCNQGCACPPGAVMTQNGCERTFDIDAGSLDNQGSFCGNGDENRYNGCNGQPYGFTWQDNAAGNYVVLGVDVQVEEGINCSGPTQHAARLNGASIGSFSTNGTCDCFSSHSQSGVSASPGAYVVGGVNSIAIDGTSCDGLSRGPALGNNYARVKVTYNCGVDLCIGVTCAPPGACQDTGVCNPGTGQCSYATQADLTQCGGGNVCVNGACGPDLCANVSCQAQDQCHVPGVCDYHTGQCSNPNAANFTSCDDGDPSTATSACYNGACLGGYTHALFANGQGYSCPTGATVFTYPAPVPDPTDSNQAKAACEACYGAGNCYLESADCAGLGWGPHPAGQYQCGEAYFGFQNGCSGDDGRSWYICSSYTTFGYWGKY